MPIQEDKQIAKEIMIAYISHVGPEKVQFLFETTIAQESQFEPIWKRIVAAVSGTQFPPSAA